MSQPTLLGLSGSLRSNATNRLLLREAARLFGPCDYAEANLELPLYNGDDEDREGRPDAVEQLVAQIGAADAVLISTPEYNGGISGVLKNALDWISRSPDKVWEGKPVAVMSAADGRSGGARAQTMLRTCLVPFRPRLALAPEVMLADSRKQFDENGQLISDQYRASLQRLVHALKADLELSVRQDD
ncbi:NADPH-dependent FMN reductase [Shimia biformata]|uniref:NADPH-dependent FMN reductase n=1 Tax=Shimia biformata TaxID=1294299 RepID=UPI00195196EB|nr:NAD(P)H-dependent oxidoreductase [Shimia biformata]